ncbi:hypothetical protein [Tabrizicola sp. BL-A-41-H6]|uniref:hypothetical protein n=1 Tax=Tabrizicola sp. BL-A-41-H6 TaxID=3421107 RepID=UPI003D668C62
MRSALFLICLLPVLMGCQSSAPASVNDPDVIVRCTAESGFTARAAAARAAGATGRISSTPEELAAINACAGGQSTTLQPVGGVPQSTTRKVTATGTTETYIYGSPPAATAASTPVRTGSTGGRYCNVLMGGAGYGCLKP